jgi:hypothetical protein
MKRPLTSAGQPTPVNATCFISSFFAYKVVRGGHGRRINDLPLPARSGGSHLHDEFGGGLHWRVLGDKPPERHAQP